MSYDYKNNLISTSSYPLSNAQDIQAIFLEGTELQLFNTLFNSIPYNDKHIEEPSNFLKLYKKYPGEKKDFVQYAIDNVSRYSWSKKTEDLSYVTNSENFENFWGFKVGPKTPTIFSIFIELDKESKLLLFPGDETYSTVLFNAIQNSLFLGKDEFFTPYETKQYVSPKENDNTETSKFIVGLSDHILLQFIKNKDFDLLEKYLTHIHSNVYSDSKKIGFFDKFEIVADLKIESAKDKYTQIIEPRPDSSPVLCSTLNDVLWSISIDKPQLLKGYIKQVYSEVSTIYCDWAKQFITFYPKPNKENLNTFNEFCQVCLNDEFFMSGDKYSKVLIELLNSDNCDYANIFLKKVKNISLKKYMSSNIDSRIWSNVLETTKNIELKDNLLKIDSNFLFSIPLNDRPHNSQLAIIQIYKKYCQDIDLKNENNSKICGDRSYYDNYESQQSMNISFIQSYLNKNFNTENIYELLLKKPIFKEVRELGYTSNLHYLLNLDMGGNLIYLLNDIVLTEFPQLQNFKLKNKTIDEKIEHLKTIEQLLKQSLFLPSNEHSAKNLQEQTVRTLDANKKTFLEINTSEQMANIFHLKNGHLFTQTMENDKDSSKFIFAELLPNYIAILNDLSRQEISNKIELISKYSNNILNFFENSLNGLSIYQSFNSNSYGYINDNNINFINSCFNFIISSGVYSKDEILNCIDKLQKSSLYLYSQGNKEVVNEHIYYINESNLNIINDKMQNFYINLESTYLDLNIQNNVTVSNKNLKF